MFRLSMLNVGQGESFVLEFADGSFAVIDGGPLRQGPLLEFVRTKMHSGAVFHWALVTQWDADHVRGLIDVILEYPPREIVHPGIDLPLLNDLLVRLDPTQTTRRVVDEFWDVVTAQDIPISPAWARLPFPNSVPELEGWFLSPSRNLRDEIRQALEERGRFGMSQLRELGNRASVVCWFRVHGRRFFLPGEIESDQYEEVLMQFPRRRGASLGEDARAHVIKLGHHGSVHNNPVELFQHFATDDVKALVSAGGRYGHPSPVALRLLRDSTISGQPFCTNLAQGCARILNGESAEDLEWVRAMVWTAEPNPGQTCHDHVDVRIDAVGRRRVETSSTPNACPFGGRVR